MPTSCPEDFDCCLLQHNTVMKIEAGGLLSGTACLSRSSVMVCDAVGVFCIICSYRISSFLSNMLAWVRLRLWPEVGAGVKVKKDKEVFGES